ncbi:general substrate transporter [Dactylonectria macrodidyma]|uniref:General substrate transporter n=1 Tax=Dactylonectria macrodidyma TaxID=307937 RepID=A0A9P9EQN2_9HYPO|nr:general substrate transporter [Dactylonectria macrodidyma]
MFTNSEKAATRHYTWRTVAYVTAISIGSLAHGYMASVIGTTIGQPSFIEYMGPELIQGKQLSLVVGMYYAGGFIGACVTAPLADRIGRKWTAFVGALLSLIFNGICAGSVNPSMFIAFRFFVGLSSTILFTNIPVWLTELVPPEGRGVLVDAHPILINFGYCIASYVGVGFFYVEGQNQQWRGPLAVGCFPALLAVLSVPFLPESPRFLLMKGREEAAWEIVRDFHRDANDQDHQYATREFEQMKQQIELDRSMEVSYREMVIRPSYRKRLLVGGALIFFLQGSGALVINNYGVYLYAALGYDAEKQLHFQAGWVAVGAAVNWAAVLIVDRMPRPWLIAIGFAGCLGCLIAEAAIQATSLGSDNEDALRAGVSMLYTFVFFYGFFLDGSTFFYIGEIFPNHLRAQGMTFVMALLNLLNIVWQIAGQYALETIKWKFYLPFIILTAVSVVVVPLTFPDTRNMPLEEIAALFGDEVVATSSPKENQEKGNFSVTQVNFSDNT